MGSGVRLGMKCLPGPEEMYIPAVGDVIEYGGESGIVTGGYELLLGLMGFERKGLGKAGLDMFCGLGGGDGVEVVDRNVGPGSPESGDTN